MKPLLIAAFAFTAIPAYAQDTTQPQEVATVSTIQTIEPASIRTIDYTVNLDSDSVVPAASLVDYEIAQPGEANGPDVSFNLP